MPNWCQNKLQICCEQTNAEQLKSRLFAQDEKGEWYLDFELLVPMPASLNIECSTAGDHAMQFLKLSPNKRLTRPLLKKYIRSSEVERIYRKAKQCRWYVGDFTRWLLKHPDEQKVLWLNLDLGQQYLSNLAQYGHKDWYDWSYANWGCKWNVCASSCEVIFHDCGDIDCFFDTPWGPPDNWFDTLCKTFPDVEFTLSFFESGMWFAGEYVANLDGSHYEITIDDSEIREFAENVFGEEFYDEDDELA